jgi:triacylglycerol esterase/lipase EstA (alpha/beta hydrolase family)
MARFRALAFLLVACAATAGAACAPAAGEPDPGEEPENDLLARESGFGSDPDYVVRQRVLFEKESDDIVRFERQPFSHRAKRWHVFPMTTYPGAKIGVRFMSDDRNMAQVGEVRLYGPAFSDGSFPKARTVVLNEHGQAEIPAAVLDPGRYVVVVGPREKASFLLRYPGNVVSLKLPNAPEATDFSLTLTKDGWTASTGTETYRIVSPAPDHAADAKTFRLKTSGSYAKEIDCAIGAWKNFELYTNESGSADEGVLGTLEDTSLLLKSEGVELRRLVVEAVRVGKSEPFLVRTLPEKLPQTGVPADLRGKPLTLVQVPDCQTNECRAPVIADDKAAECAVANGAACGDGFGCFEGKCQRQLPADVLEKLSESYKPLFLDPKEPSTYSIEIACSEHCTPTPVESGRMTKYPVYYAHGFNSNKDAWSSILGYLGHVPGFGDRSRAESVPAFEPIESRANRLRQRLATFIEYMQDAAPISGERMRINVVAHSMGGLDSRALVSSPRFNEDCEKSECEDIDDRTNAKSKTNCCAPSENGKPTMWRDRIASVTTLSTPHRGSSFASWGLKQLADDATLSPALKLAAEKLFGFDEAGYQGFRQTLDALSVERGEERESALTPPNPARVYTWACATKEEKCGVPAGIDAPAKGADGAFLLPAPNDRPTIFSWAAMACATGGCGNVVDPMLLLPYGVMTRAGEKKNDGVVGVDRARYGVFMGVLPADHFDWTRMANSASSGKQALEWLFGLKTEPIERFHQTWLERLAKSGY